MAISNCPPRPTAPTTAQMADPCWRAAQLQAALMDVLAGNGGSRTVQLRDGDRWKSWSAVNVSELRAELRVAQRECEAASGRGARMFRAGPYNYQGR
jgi:hypothetical protein